MDSESIKLTLPVWLILTALVLVWVHVSRVDCNDPAVWATADGVRACAVNGGQDHE